jgi:hypothetical protein
VSWQADVHFDAGFLIFASPCDGVRFYYLFVAERTDRVGIAKPPELIEVSCLAAPRLGWIVIRTPILSTVQAALHLLLKTLAPINLDPPVLSLPAILVAIVSGVESSRRDQEQRYKDAGWPTHFHRELAHEVLLFFCRERLRSTMASPTNARVTTTIAGQLMEPPNTDPGSLFISCA